MPDHIFRNHHIVVHLAIVDLEQQADEIWQDRRATSLCADRYDPLAWLGSHDGEPGSCQYSS